MLTTCEPRKTQYVPLIEDSEGEFVQVEGAFFTSVDQADKAVQALGYKPVLHNWEGGLGIVYSNYINGSLLVLEEYHG